MSSIGDIVGTVLGTGTSSDASAASSSASSTLAQAQQNALDYYKEQTQGLTDLSGAATSQLGSLLGLEGYGDYDYTSDSLYSSGVDSIMANAAVTGGVRGGNTQSALGSLPSTISSIRSNQLSSLVGAGSSAASNIANMMTGIGQTNASGILGAYNSGVQAAQSNLNSLSGLIGAGTSLYSAFSDSRLKTDEKKIASTPIKGINKYTWEWNEFANDIGLNGRDFGYMVPEVETVYPDLVIVDEDTGFKKVNIKELEKRIYGEQK